MKYFTGRSINCGHKNVTPIIRIFQNGLDAATKRKVIMRIQLIALLIGISFMSVSATTTAQTITMTLKNAPLVNALNEIKKQSGYHLIYDEDLLKQSNTVTLNLKQAGLIEALKQCFEGQPLSYQIQNDNRVILIKEKPKSILEKVKEMFNNSIITGKVTDENGLPLAGVNIFIKERKIFVTSNSKGEYSIDSKIGEKITFTYTGYIKQEIIVSSLDPLNVGMSLNISALDETVIKGYYNTNKQLNTGNVSSVKSEDISKQPVGDPLSALQGKIPGLFIQQTSGASGRVFNVRLRGRNSIANGNDPLYIVDGVQFNSTPLNSSQFLGGSGTSTSPLNDINPSDIESIDVLKDADATAIYGSRGANGVILIRTKKGKVGTTTFATNIYTGFGKTSKEIDLLNTEQYLEMRRKAFANDGLSPDVIDYDLNGVYDQNKYTNWQKVLIGGTAKVTDAQVSISGGTGLTQFRIGSGYRKEGTVFPGDLGSQRGSVLASLDHQSENQKLQISFSTNYVRGLNKLPTIDLTPYILLAPNSPNIFDSAGNLNWENSTWNNPYSSILQKNEENTNNLNSNLTISYKLLSGLSLKSSFGYNNQKLEQSQIVPYTSLDPAIYTDPTFSRSNYNSNRSVDTWIIEPQITYTRNIWKGKIDVLMGSTFQNTRQKSLTVFAAGFSSDQLLDNLVSGSYVSLSENSKPQYRYNAIYGRLSYNLSDKYVINLTGRRDGSSRFGPGKQFGDFGAIGIAWLLFKENFMHTLFPTISYAKIRASLGNTGNDKLSNYGYLSTYSSFSQSYQGVNGLYPTQLTNTNFGWEKVSKKEIALELGFLRDRILINASWYQNRTGNQLVGYTLPDITGFKSVQGNLPAIIENKGFEIEINSTNLTRNEFSWSTSFNLSVPRNKLIDFPNIKATSYASTYEIGMPLFIQFRYIYTGIDPTTGLYTFQDQNNDTKITSTADRKPIFIGQDFFGGFSNTLKLKNLQLDFSFSFTKQTGLNYLYNQFAGGFIGGAGNQPESILNASDLQPFTTKFSGVAYTQSQLFEQSNGRITDASYIRLRNVSVSWNFSKYWKSFDKIKSARIYLQGQNLLTITKYKGFDPEISNGLALAPQRVLTAGIQFSL